MSFLKQFSIVGGILMGLILFRFWVEFLGYIQFTSQPIRLVTGLVVAQYLKVSRRGKRYWVYKIKGEGLTIYTTIYQKKNRQKGKKLREKERKIFYPSLRPTSLPVSNTQLEGGHPNPFPNHPNHPTLKTIHPVSPLPIIYPQTMDKHQATNYQSTVTTIYSTSHSNQLNRLVVVEIPTKRVSFKGYLYGFYLPPYFIFWDGNYPEWYRQIALQHKSPTIAHLFQALFLGGGVEGEVRAKLGALGVAHLLALSGLHLGLIAGGVYLLLFPVYRFFHRRFFPYRNSFIDLGTIIIFISLLYLFFTGSPPSLARAVGMEIGGFLIWVGRGRLTPVGVLGIGGVIAFLLSPSLVWSVGFLFSVVAVYLILLYLEQWGTGWKSWLFLMPYIQLSMIPLVHHFFTPFSPMSILSPFFSLLFPIFYFGELIFHCIGIGGITDWIVEGILELAQPIYHFSTPPFLYYLFIGIILGALVNRRLLIIPPIFGIVVLGMGILG